MTFASGPPCPETPALQSRSHSTQMYLWSPGNRRMAWPGSWHPHSNSSLPIGLPPSGTAALHGSPTGPVRAHAPVASAPPCPLLPLCLPARTHAAEPTSGLGTCSLCPHLSGRHLLREAAPFPALSTPGSSGILFSALQKVASPKTRPGTQSAEGSGEICCWPAQLRAGLKAGAPAPSYISS